MATGFAVVMFGKMYHFQNMALVLLWSFEFSIYRDFCLKCKYNKSTYMTINEFDLPYVVWHIKCQEN